ncbi:hypothetical protein, conserved [Angomonas deanei]|uniref:Leucine-rich domain-containing protein n=1 Tax=Angomonas deanei TaxID=59799 RepID=A0A7G2C6S4_9TRYP|nr:hypothetical protein, conserved [Angomonas deanei]
MDVSNCYLERTAPFVLGQLLSTPQPSELRHITSLRLDGNYFSNDGLANALSSIAEECERTVLFPVLEQLYLNNMNLDSSAVSGVLSFLFPIDRVAAQRFSVQLPAVPEVFQRPHTVSATPTPIFPAIKVLCLSDNPGLGTAGFTCVLQHLLTSHFSDHQLSVLDLSRCDLDKKCGKPLKQYVKEIDEAHAEGTFPVVTQNIVLMGNARFKVPNHSEGTTKIVI